MIYTILISIVFIAEVIIAITIIQNLLRLDKAVLAAEDTIISTRGGIKDISILIRKISQQTVILSEDFVEKVKKEREDELLKMLSKALMSLFIVNLNFKIIKKIRKSKITKVLAKGLSFLGSMV